MAGNSEDLKGNELVQLSTPLARNQVAQNTTVAEFLASQWFEEKIRAQFLEQGYAAILEENGFVVLRRLADPDAKDLIVSSLVEALPPFVTAKQKRAAKVNALDIHRKAMEWKRPRARPTSTSSSVQSSVPSSGDSSAPTSSSGSSGPQSKRQKRSDDFSEFSSAVVNRDWVVEEMMDHMFVKWKSTQRSALLSVREGLYSINRSTSVTELHPGIGHVDNVCTEFRFRLADRRTPGSRCKNMLQANVMPPTSTQPKYYLAVWGGPEVEKSTQHSFLAAFVTLRRTQDVKSPKKCLIKFRLCLEDRQVVVHIGSTKDTFRVDCSRIFKLRPSAKFSSPAVRLTVDCPAGSNPTNDTSSVYTSLGAGNQVFPSFPSHGSPVSSFGHQHTSMVSAGYSHTSRASSVAGKRGSKRKKKKKKKKKKKEKKKEREKPREEPLSRKSPLTRASSMDLPMMDHGNPSTRKATNASDAVRTSYPGTLISLRYARTGSSNSLPRSRTRLRTNTAGDSFSSLFRKEEEAKRLELRCKAKTMERVRGLAESTNTTATMDRLPDFAESISPSTSSGSLSPRSGDARSCAGSHDSSSSDIGAARGKRRAKKAKESKQTRNKKKKKKRETTKVKQPTPFSGRVAPVVHLLDDPATPEVAEDDTAGTSTKSHSKNKSCVVM